MNGDGKMQHFPTIATTHVSIYFLQLLKVIEERRVALLCCLGTYPAGWTTLDVGLSTFV